ncbi:hypothetical protein ASC90_26190 [Rhizobium sp. Root1220]|nr:hypothetical protein ASC90_26190 [Rhizobium sp. Root1220]
MVRVRRDPSFSVFNWPAPHRSGRGAAVRRADGGILPLADEHVSGREQGVRGPLRVTMAPTLATHLLMPDFAAFARQHPEIEMVIWSSLDGAPPAWQRLRPPSSAATR